jgi:hypothetical protein
MTKPILFIGIAVLTCASFEPQLFAQSTDGHSGAHHTTVPEYNNPHMSDQL